MEDKSHHEHHNPDRISKVLFAALSTSEGDASCEDSTGPSGVDQYRGSPVTKTEIFFPTSIHK
jgi:hypothetical protein